MSRKKTYNAGTIQGDFRRIGCVWGANRAINTSRTAEKRSGVVGAEPMPEAIDGPTGRSCVCSCSRTAGDLGGYPPVRWNSLEHSDREHSDPAVGRSFYRAPTCPSGKQEKLTVLKSKFSRSTGDAPTFPTFFFPSSRRLRLRRRDPERPPACPLGGYGPEGRRGSEHFFGHGCP